MSVKIMMTIWNIRFGIVETVFDREMNVIILKLFVMKFLEEKIL